MRDFVFMFLGRERKSHEIKHHHMIDLSALVEKSIMALWRVSRGDVSPESCESNSNYVSTINKLCTVFEGKLFFQIEGVEVGMTYR